MMAKSMLPVLLLITGKFLGSSAFWSLNTDLQLGYEIYDKSYEINAVVQGIVTAATLSNVIQSDDATRAALNSLSAVANQLRRSVSPFITQIANAAASRSNNEAWHLTAIRNAFVTHNAALTVLLNTTGPLSGLIDVTNPSLVSAIRAALTRVQLSSDSVLVSAEAITRDVAGVRVNSSLLLTPMLLSDFIDTETSEEIISSLDSVRNSLIVLSSAIRDAGRLVVAHGSIHELLSRPSSRDTTTRSIALNNFVNNYNRVINNLVSSIASNRQAAETGIYKFINRVQSTFDDSIVRPKFDKAQLPLIRAFSSVISSKVYNRTFFRTSFDTMRDSIVDSYVNGTGSVISQGSEHRDVILYLLRTSFVRQYSSCLDELVTEVQLNSNSITNKFAFCLNERTSGIVVVIPSTITWLSVIRDNINFILQRLNGCLNGQTSVAGRTAISDCIQINANNLVFYSTYLPITVESNLRPIVESAPMIFRNCINLIPTRGDGSFDEIYSRCKAEADNPTTTTTAQSSTSEKTTEDPDEGSGFDIFQ